MTSVQYATRYNSDTLPIYNIHHVTVAHTLLSTDISCDSQRLWHNGHITASNDHSQKNSLQSHRSAVNKLNKNSKSSILKQIQIPNVAIQISNILFFSRQDPTEEQITETTELPSRQQFRHQIPNNISIRLAIAVRP